MGLLITAQFQSSGRLDVPDDPEQSEHLKGSDDLFLSMALQHNPPGNQNPQIDRLWSQIAKRARAGEEYKPSWGWH